MNKRSKTDKLPNGDKFTVTFTSTICYKGKK